MSGRVRKNSQRKINQAAKKRMRNKKTDSRVSALDELDLVVDKFMNRSPSSVISSYFFRKHNKIKTKNIYSYDGDEEAYRLLNRSAIETIAEALIEFATIYSIGKMKHK